MTTSQFDPRRILGRFLGARRPARPRPRAAASPRVEGLEGRALMAALQNNQFVQILTHEAEYYVDNVINPNYEKFLGRGPTPSEKSYYINLLEHGTTDEQVLAGFAGSAEFYQTSGGTNSAWINAMYQDILGRAPTSSEVNYYLNSLQNGNTRTNIALGFATSPEHEAQVVTNDYGRYLNRVPSAAEIQYHVNNYVHGVTNEDVIAGFLGSPEFSRDHFQADTNFVDAVYKTLFQRAPTAAELLNGQTTLEGATANNVPQEALYNVTLTGTAGGQSFSLPAQLGVTPTLATSTLATSGSNDTNPRNLGLTTTDADADPLNKGVTGSIDLASNLFLFAVAYGDTSISPEVLGTVAPNTTNGTATLTVNGSASNTTRYQNSFSVGAAGSSTQDIIKSGTLTVTFAGGGATVSGTISVSGMANGSNVPVTYTANFSGSLA